MQLNESYRNYKSMFSLLLFSFIFANVLIIIGISIINSVNPSSTAIASQNPQDVSITQISDTASIEKDEKYQLFFRDLNSHLERYPELRAEDVYKFCYQAFMGIGHLISDREQALRWLQEEVDELGEPWVGDTLLVEPMGMKYLRLHLHPYLKNQGSLENLADAMLLTLKTGADSSRMQEAWSEIIKLSKKSEWLGPSYDDLITLTERLKSQNYPAIHHHEQTSDMYHFHYRILCKEVIKDLLESQGMKFR